MRVWAAAGTLALAVACAPRHAAPGPQPVWIDTDPAVGEPDRDVDDGLALVQAFHSPELAIRGVSVVFGNAPLDRAVPIARIAVSRFGPAGLGVHAGAASAADRGRRSPAVDALEAALEREPLTILVLGPATNLATVLEARPDLAPRVTRAIAVAGRRPGQRFTTGTTNPRGHRDFNFELDPAAFARLLTSRIPLVLVPFEVSSKVWLRSEDLVPLEKGGDAGRWLVAPARAWLALWTRLFGVDGFNPFDTLAVAFATHPQLLTCDRWPAAIRELPNDETEPGVQGTTVAAKAYLLVSPELPGAPEVTYCHDVAAAFKPLLLDRLSRVSGARR